MAVSTNQQGDVMAKARLNANKRKLAVKVFHKYFENEKNIYREEYYKQRKLVDTHIENALHTATQVVERAYPLEDVAQLQHYKNKYGEAVDCVAKDSCFYFQSDKVDIKTNYDGQEVEKPIRQHFSFHLDGNLNGDEYATGKEFAYAYYHDHLKQKEHTPEWFVLKGDKDENPHHRKLQDACDEELGLCSSYRYNRRADTKSAGDWIKRYQLDVIGTSHCRSRTIPCTHDEYEIMNDMLIAKQSLVQKYDQWQSNIIQRVNLVANTVKQYTYVEDVMELARQSGVQIQESDLELHSTNVALYNPTNVAQMLNDLKPKAKETRAEKIARVSMALQQQATSH